MSKCVNCLTVFKENEGFNPMYCSKVCAISKNRQSPALVDDLHARMRAVHKANKHLVTAKQPLNPSPARPTSLTLDRLQSQVRRDNV